MMYIVGIVFTRKADKEDTSKVLVRSDQFKQVFDPKFNTEMCKNKRDAISLAFLPVVTTSIHDVHDTHYIIFCLLLQKIN